MLLDLAAAQITQQAINLALSCLAAEQKEAPRIPEFSFSDSREHTN